MITLEIDMYVVKNAVKRMVDRKKKKTLNPLPSLFRTPSVRASIPTVAVGVVKFSSKVNI